MARYVASVDSHLSPDKAFEYVVDVGNFVDWDPGVRSVVQVEGDGPSLGAAYDVDVSIGSRATTMRYAIVELDEPRRAVLRAETRYLRSIDTLTVGATTDGCRVVYDAQLKLKGPLRIAEPLLRIAFRRIGDRAAAGLRRELQAESAE